MIAVLLLAAVIGVIVYSSRKARADYVVSVRSSKPGETWVFNVRDMSAQLKGATGVTLASFDVRRLDSKSWQCAELDDATGEGRAWTACDESAVDAIEEKYRRYNG